MKNLLVLTCVALAAGAFCQALQAAAPTGSLDACNVIWDSLGASSADSMPVGNGDIGLNVWTEANGDLLFYIGKSDAWGEDVRSSRGLLKVGRIRVSFDPNPFANNAQVRQILRLNDGEIEIDAGMSTVLRVWVDANHPVIHVDAASTGQLGLRAAFESIRPLETVGQPAAATPSNQSAPWENAGLPAADTVFSGLKDRVEWYHSDGDSGDPFVKKIVFGAAMRGDSLVADGFMALRSAAPASSQHLLIDVLTTNGPDVGQWQAQLEHQAAVDGALPPEETRAAHEAWWHAFWDRSWIFVSGNPQADAVTRGYVLQRFVTACAGRGAAPIKFNGSIFVVDNPAYPAGKDKNMKDITKPVSADDRMWGGQYWFQNTRPMYWSRLMAGDFDLMQPLFRTYRAMLERNAALVKEYYGHDGSYFAETAPFYGGFPKVPPEERPWFTNRYYTPILELSAMMLNYYAYTGDDAFARETLVPIATAGVTFFDQHFPHVGGRLLLEPDNAIETYWKIRNPAPDIAGLHYVIARLLELPLTLVNEKRRADLERVQSELPPLPIGEKNGRRMLLSFEPWQDPPSSNGENPELYAVYPFRLYGLGKPDLDLARNAFAARLHPQQGCWSQDPEHAALLGISDVVSNDVAFNFMRKSPRLKFPAFWAKGHDYDPDEDNGGNGEFGLQLMLMQADGRKILLLPAWPKGWNADFKLHAPLETTVEGKVRDGKIVSLKVTPEARRADVTILDGGL